MTIIKASGNSTEKKLTLDRSKINSGNKPEKNCDCTDTENVYGTTSGTDKKSACYTNPIVSAENQETGKDSKPENCSATKTLNESKNDPVKNNVRSFGISDIRSSKSLEKIMPLPENNSASARKALKKSEFSEITLGAAKKAASSSDNSNLSPSGELKLDVSDQTVLDDIKKKLNLGSVKGIFGKMHFRKKNAIVVASLALICGALVINHTLTGGFNRGTDVPPVDDGSSAVGAPADGNDPSAAQNGDEAYFSSAAVNRRRARDESLEVLQLVVDSEDALQESKDSALQSMSKIAAQIEQESNIESLVKAKGFEDCIAVVSDSSATVIVASDGLLANEVAQITEIICEQTSLPASGINIIEKTAG